MARSAPSAHPRPTTGTDPIMHNKSFRLRSAVLVALWHCLGRAESPQAASLRHNLLLCKCCVIKKKGSPDAHIPCDFCGHRWLRGWIECIPQHGPCSPWDR